MGQIHTAELPDAVLQPVRWGSECVELLDQTLLPGTRAIVTCATPAAVASGITEMKVRGAPAIGVAAAYGYALGARLSSGDDIEQNLADAYSTLVRARPTAVNLAWALNRMRGVYVTVSGQSIETVRSRLLAEAVAIHEESRRADEAIGMYGAELLDGRSNILTHCNAGPLATAGYGTAIGVIRRAYDRNPALSVLVDETRPFLQGARLTAWELMTLGIPATLITDSMSGYMMRSGQVDAVVVGADRIAANGDVANKIGTYSVAVLARAHGIPFYVAAPTSTVDLATACGDDIPIEQRDPSEVTELRGMRIAPAGMKAANPAFDVTPANLVTAIVTENGVAQAPYEETLRGVMEGVAIG